MSRPNKSARRSFRETIEGVVLILEIIAGIFECF